MCFFGRSFFFPCLFGCFCSKGNNLEGSHASHTDRAALGIRGIVALEKGFRRAIKSLDSTVAQCVFFAILCFLLVFLPESWGFQVFVNKDRAVSLRTGTGQQDKV